MVLHTQQVLQSITEIEAALSQAEAAQRGYLLAATKPFLDERDEALKRVTDRLQLLRALTSDNPLQQQRIAAIEEKIPGRIALMHENAAIRDSAGLGAVGTRVSMGEGQRASASIYNETAGLRTEELRLLEKRQEDAASRRAYAQTVLIAAALIGLMVLIPGYIALVLQSRDRERSKRNLQLMADALPGAVYQVRHDPDGKPNLMFISAGARKLRGLPREVEIDLPTLTAQIDERDRQAFLDALEHARTSLEPLSYEYRVHLSDGSMRWMHHEATMLRENDGSVLANGYVADVTRRHELQLALHEAREAADDASHAKSTFLATMSHEIRTPMNAVQGMLELLSLTRLDAEQRATLAIIQQSGRSLLRIIDDVLDFSKIEAGRLDVRPEPASIAAVIDDVYNIYLGNASSKGLWLGKRVDPAISPALSVDALRLRQILSNFVSNAIKFTTFGSIEIAVDLIERKDDVERLRFSVKDTGPGIAAEDQRRLFQPFMQGEGAARGKAGGTGLGLTICRRLATLMGGSVDVASEAGKGTTLFLELGLAVADPTGLPPKVEPSHRATLAAQANLHCVAPPIDDAEREGTLVLLADDHPTNLMLLERQMQTLGYASESAVDGAEALEKWKSGRYGLIVTDCNMPVMDGYALARAIRVIEGARGLARTPIIACTANALGGEAEHCFAAGMDDYLVKPATLAQLLARIQNWLPLSMPDAGERDGASSAAISPGSASSGTQSASAEPSSAGPSSAESDCPIDRSVLAGLTAADPQMERAVLANFRRVNDDDAVALTTAVAEHSIADVTRSAHRIKGACRMVGARALAGVCETIERASRAGDWGAVRSNMGAFDDKRARLNRWIDALPNAVRSG